tara:strand:+ start:5171 stop:10564 length:5394 start_codon:yes stop_codon:yes gene_type:complete
MPTATAQPEEVDVFSGSEWEIEPAPAATLGADPFSGPEWEEETLAAPGPVVSTPDKVRPTIDVLAERMDNPSYIPSFEEWDRHRQTPNHSDMSYGESGELLKGIVKDTGKKLGGMIWESGRLVVGAETSIEKGEFSKAQGQLAELGISWVEGLARGSVDLAIVTRQLAEMPYDASPDHERPVHRRAGQVKRGGRETGRRALRQAPSADLVKRRKALHDRKSRLLYARAMTTRRAMAVRMAAESGDSDIIQAFFDYELPKINQQIAEGGSYIADLPTLASGGIAMIPKAVNRLGGKLLTGATSRTARGMKAAENAIDDVAQQAIESSPAGAMATAAAAGQAGPELLTAAAAFKGAQQTVGGVRALGESLIRQPSDIGLIEGVAKNADNPEWMRRLANAGYQVGLDPLGRLATRGVVGAGVGAGAGTALGGAADGWEGAVAGFGEGLVTGAFASSTVGLYQDVSGATKRQAAANDIERFREKSTVDPLFSAAAFDALMEETKLQIATVDAANPDLNIRFVPEATMRGQLMSTPDGDNAGAVNNAKAFYDPVSRSIWVNADSPTIKQDFMHEVGEAIWASPATDKSSIAVEFLRLYGEKGVQELGRKLIRERTRNSVTGAILSPEAIDGLVDQQLLKDPDFVVRELFAETFMDQTADQAFADVRRGKRIYADESPLLRAWLRTKGEILSRMGFDVEDTGDLQFSGKDTQFGGDVRLKSDPRLRKAIRKYAKDVDTYYGQEARAGRRQGLRRGTLVSLQDLASSPYAGWVARADGSFENDFATMKDGKVTAKDGVDIEAALKKRREDVSSVVAQEISGQPNLRVGKGEDIINSSAPLAGPENPNLARRADASGRRVVVSGTKLPEALYQVDSLSPEAKANMRLAEEAMENGDVFSAWYQQIGTSRGELSWARSVKKNLGNLAVSMRQFKPFAFALSKEGNLNIVNIDIGTAFEKMRRWKQTGKLDQWDNDLKSFREDLFRYLDNHAKGREGADGIGITKRDVINAFFGAATKDGINKQLTDAMNAGEGGASTLIRSFRVDRMHSVNSTPEKRFYYDHEKVRKNLRLRSKGAIRTDLAKTNRENPDALPAAIKKSKGQEVWKQVPIMDKDGDPTGKTKLEAEVQPLSYELTLGVGLPKKTPEGKVPKFPENKDGTPSTDPKRLKTYERGVARAAKQKQQYKKQVDKVAATVVEEVQPALDRPELAAAIGWYGTMRDWLQKTFGANMEKFAQVLGATSAQTDVRMNFLNTLDAMHNLAKGSYEGILTEFHEHVLNVKKRFDSGEAEAAFEAEQVLKKAETGKRDSWDVEKQYPLAINKWSKDKLPRKSNGKAFNTNGLATMKALYGVWIQTAGGPKTPNFAGNLTGRTMEATIDVWAARFLRRKIYDGKGKRWRIQPRSEQGVKDNDFFFGQAVFRKAAEDMNMSPDDLQALMWFKEKDVWAENGWTKGEGANKSSFEEQTANIKAERFQLGVTTNRSDFFNQEAQEGAQKELRETIGAIPGVLASRANISEGFFASSQWGDSQEPSIDVEFTVREGADVQAVVDAVRDIGTRHEQEGVFISQIVDGSHPNARPGIEVGFKSPQDSAEMLKTKARVTVDDNEQDVQGPGNDIISKIKQAFENTGGIGYTIAKDEQGRMIGFRAQYIPEYSEVGSLADAQKGAREWRAASEKLREIFNSDESVSYAQQTWFNTQSFQATETQTGGVGPLRDAALGRELERLEAANTERDSLRVDEGKPIEANGKGLRSAGGMGGKPAIARTRDFPRGGQQIIYTDGSRVMRLSDKAKWRSYDAKGKLLGFLDKL